MEEIFIAIMEQIAREMPELSLIDEEANWKWERKKTTIRSRSPVC